MHPKPAHLTLWLNILMVAVAAGCDVAGRNAPHVSPSAEPGNVLVLDAPDCVATTGDGEPFSLPAIAAGSEVLIPKGTRLTSQCFTTAEVAK